MMLPLWQAILSLSKQMLRAVEEERELTVLPRAFFFFTTPGPSSLNQKSNFKDSVNFRDNAPKIAPTTGQWLQVRVWDNLISEAPRSGLLSLAPVSAKELKESAFQGVL
jgi:hypothetical protein